MISDTKTYSLAAQLLAKSKRVLIALPTEVQGDSLAAAVALAESLKNSNISYVVVSKSEVPDKFAFLTKQIRPQSEIEDTDVLVINVATHAKPLHQVSYEQGSGHARIYLTAKEGRFTKDDVIIEEHGAHFDCIVTIGAASLEQLGSIYAQSTELFFSTPIINIDTAGSNEYFGAVNVVDITTLSFAELLFPIIEQLGSESITKPVATALLASILSRTQSFQDVRTSPITFSLAARLIDLGGDYQEVVQHVYKTKPLPLLQLWGRSLARLRSVGDGTYISVLQSHDLEKTGQSISEGLLRDVLAELLENTADSKVVALIAPQGDQEMIVAFALHATLSVERLTSELKAKTITQSSIFHYHCVIAQGLVGTSTEIEHYIEEQIKRIT